jgi:hypothetical protein
MADFLDRAGIRERWPGGHFMGKLADTFAQGTKDADSAAAQVTKAQHAAADKVLGRSEWVQG